MTLFHGMATGACVAGFLAIGVSAVAQQSPSFKITESVQNCGGDPVQGTFPASASFRVRLDALGEAAVGRGLASASYRSDGGFVSDYAPPGEVRGLRFAGKTGLQWEPDPSVGTYNVYRDPVSGLPGSYGGCLSAGVRTESATDAQTPSPGVAWFYLVTAENRLAQEGTKGRRSNGAERPNTAPCP